MLAPRQGHFNYRLPEEPNQGFPEREPCPVCRPSQSAPSGVVSSEGMDLTGFEPAPATLTGCRASVTPQAHACNGNGETWVLHVHPSHRSPGIPEWGVQIDLWPPVSSLSTSGKSSPPRSPPALTGTSRCPHMARATTTSPTWKPSICCYGP